VDRLTGRVALTNNDVAKAQATDGSAFAHPSFEATTGFLGVVLQIHGIHRAFETDVELVDLALCKSDKTDAGKAQPFKQVSDIFLVTRKTVERFGNDHLEFPAAGVLKEAFGMQAVMRSHRSRPDLYTRGDIATPLSMRARHILI
jgi:hypothetical protein